MYTQNTTTLPEKDLVFQILVETKRVAGEYATAVTEANCQNVRQMFTSLLNDTLQIQGEIYQLMSQQGWYQPPSPAMRHEIANQIQQHQQELQQTNQFIQQRVSTSNTGPMMYSAPQSQPQNFGASANNYRM